MVAGVYRSGLFPFALRFGTTILEVVKEYKYEEKEEEYKKE